jgi:hypothetical protein
MPDWSPRSARSRVVRAQKDGRIADALRLAADADRIDLIEEIARAATRAENVTLATVAAARACLELRVSLEAARRVGVPLSMLGRMRDACDAAATHLWWSTERFAAVVPRRPGTESSRLMTAGARHVERLRALQRELISMRDGLFELTIAGTSAGEHERVTALLDRLDGVAGALEADLREDRTGR